MRALFEWAIVLVAATTQHLWLSLWWLPLTALLIASRQHAMLVLMHDAAHFRAARSRLANDLFGDALAWPLLLSMRGYRRHHNKHHVADALNTDGDPDFERKQRRAPQNWTFPMRRSQLVALLIRDVLMLNTHESIYEGIDAKNIEGVASPHYNAARGLFYVALFSALTLTGTWRWYLLYWVLPSFTWLKAILRLRSLADHFALPPAPGAPRALAQTRTIVAPWWERLVLAPAHISVHGPHHAYSSVPYYHLREAHEAMLAAPGYRATVSPSYWHAFTHELAP